MITRPMWDKGIMAIDLDNLYEELMNHVYHRVVIVRYSDYAVALECETCGVVLLSAEEGDQDVVL